MPRIPPDDRRQQIMDAALPLFAAQGFRGASNRDIARAAGMTPGLIYHYFASKEDLYRAVIDEYSPFAQLGLSVDALRDQPVEQVLRQLIAGLHGVFTLSPRFTQVVRIAIVESLHDPAKGQQLNTLLRRLIDPLSGYLAEQIARGALRPGDPTLMAQSFLGNAVIFFIRRVIGGDAALLAVPLEQFTAFTVESFLRAFRA